MRRRSTLLCKLSLLVVIVYLSACKRDKPTIPSAGPGGENIPVAAPGSVVTEHFLLAHYRASEVRQSTLFAELKEGIRTTIGGDAAWEDIEKMIEERIGTKLAYLETGIFCLPEAPAKERDLNRFILIALADRPIPKKLIMHAGERPVQGQPGFYHVFDTHFAHFPDEKILVLLHPSLVDRYKAGYAVDRNGWPMNEAFRREAEKHTLFAVANFSTIGEEIRQKRDVKEIAALLAAKSVTLAANLKGKDLSVAIRAAFADVASAETGKEKIVSLLAELANEIRRSEKDKNVSGEFEILFAPIKEAHRAVAEARIEVVGADVTITTHYKADFDAAKLVDAYVRQVKQSASQLNSVNNLKQIGIGLGAYENAYRHLPTGNIGLKGMPINNPQGKPLLSWRVAILPFIEQESLYKEFHLDEPWDSEHNKKLIERMPKVYASPVPTKAKAGETHYQLIVGPSASVPGLRLQAITDGTSNTIAVMEAAQPVEWTKPGDVSIPYQLADKLEGPIDIKKFFGGVHPNVVNALFWDGTVRSISLNRIEERTLWHLITRFGGEVTPGDF